MKLHLLFFFLAFGVLTLNGCKDDDEDVLSPGAVLNYAGPQFTSPAFDAGNVNFLAYYPPAVTSQFNGQSLTEVEFDLVRVPQAVFVGVYEDSGNPDFPGQLIYDSGNIAGRLSGGAQTVTQTLDNAIRLQGQGLWIGVEVVLATDRAQSVGCDRGENYNPNGDRLNIEGAGNQRIWTDFQTVSGERVNWNVRGILR